MYREADTIVRVSRTLLSRATRLLLSAMHLVGSRTVVLAGLLLAVWTGYGAGRNLWFSLNGTVATGVVTRQIEEFSADWEDGQPAPVGAEVAGIDLAAAERRYRAVVQFSDGGRAFDVVSELRGPAQVYATGSNVQVVYPPGRPERARLRPELPDGWMQSGLLLAATMLGAGSARLWWRLAQRRARRRRVVTPSV